MLFLQLEEQELENYPFRPQINPDSKEILDMKHYKPIHERVGDLQRAKVGNGEGLGAWLECTCGNTVWLCRATD